MTNECAKLVDVFVTAQETLPEILALITEGNKTGGFCCISNQYGRPLLIFQVGEVASDEKAAKYFELCQEKASRLAESPEHISSWQSRCPDQLRYGGAIRVEDLIFSFSGFPEWWDETFMVVVAQRCFQYVVKFKLVKEITNKSANPHTFPFFETGNTLLV